MQIFLLHFAGGNRYSYEKIKNKFSYYGSVLCLELPGRGKRINEKLLNTKTDAVNDYVNQIYELRDSQPYVIYGHSMGATLGLSVTKKMEDYNDAPLALIVTGNAGPGAKNFNKHGEQVEKEICHVMNDHDFKNKLRELGGISEEVLENEEIYTFFSPIIRADFEILEKSYGFENDLKINVPIYAAMGDEEHDVSQINNWRRYTNGRFKSKIFKGDHFFINNHVQELAGILMESTSCLAQY